MKKILIFALSIMIANLCFATGGEFFITPTANTQHTLHVQSIGNAWVWNATTQEVILSPAYDKTFNDLSFAFDSPKNIDVAKNGVMPWGQMQFTLSSSSSRISFTIDFRDEFWSTQYANGADIYLHFNDSSGYAYLDPPSGSDVVVSNGRSYKIWEAYHETVPPDTIDFLPPVFLKNIINSSNAGGTLHINTHSYDSGDTALAAYGIHNDIGTDIERFTNYQNSGITYKHNNWNNDNTDYLRTRDKIIQSINNVQNANFAPVTSVTVQSILKDNGNNVDSIQFQDPWYVEANGTQPKQFDTFAVPFHPTGAYGQATGGVFLNQNPDPNNPNVPYYSIRVPITKTINGFTSYFQNWSMSKAVLGTVSIYTDNNGVNYWQVPVVFDSAGATVTANYKAHLGTGNPSLANTKNQRRIIWGQDHSGIKCWLSVYESMGDVWMTMYDESGYVLVPETRLNTKQGAASNPTISNTVNFGSSDYDRAVIGWLENNNGNIELHIQSVNFQGGSISDVWGWAGNDPNRISSYAVLNGNLGTNPYGYWGIQDNPTPTARPVLSLLPNGNGGLLMTYAYETSASGKGIVAGQFQTTASTQDLNSALSVAEKTVSIDMSAKLPALATLDASHVFIYYTTGSYSTLKLSEFNYATSAVNNLTLASGDAIINSIQVASNKIMDTRALVADVTNYSVGAYGGQTVDYFYSGVPMYGYAPPVLRTKYNSLNQPSVMSVDLSHSSASYTPVDVVMNLAPVGSYLMQYRYQLNGTAYSTSVGGNVAGTFLREKASTGTDSVITLVKTSSTPAGIVRYPATGGGLQKQLATDQITSQIITSTKSVRLWLDKKGSWHKVIFNFDTLNVDILKDQEEGNTLCAVRFSRVPKAGSFVSQADSLESSIAFDLEREGKVVKSFGSSFWNNLSAGNIPGIQNGDVVRFTLPGNDVDSVWGYEEVSYVGMKDLNKENADQQDVGIPAPTSYAVSQNYPNPFNPSTLIHYEIPNNGIVVLKVFDGLGREVKTLVNQFQSRGRYDINFNASDLSSGVYFYQLKAGDYTSIKKMVLLK